MTASKRWCTMREKLFVWIVALFVGGLGGLLSSWMPSSKQSEIKSIVSANEFLCIDKNSGGYAILGIKDGQPRLTFYGVDNVVKGFVGLEQGEPALSFKRQDGSQAWLSPNDDGPGWHFTLLKSLGEGKGVFMSTLTADKLGIYQSRIGSIDLGNIDGKMIVKVVDPADNITWQSATSGEGNPPKK